MYSICIKLLYEDVLLSKTYEPHFCLIVVAPEVNMLLPRLGITLGSETVLQCSCSSSPIGVCVWKKDGRDLRISGKYELNPYNDDPETITLSLTISDIKEEDLGRYECHAQNELGEDSDYTDLYGKPQAKNRTVKNNSTFVCIDVGLGWFF